MRTSCTKLLASVLGAAALVAVGCGDDDSDESAASEEGLAGGAATTTAPAEPGVVEVTAVDYAFQGLPARIDAGTKLTLTNRSESELHEIVAFRLADEEARPVAELMELPEAEFDSLFAGPPAMVQLALPGEGGFAALGDGTLTEPGRYLVLCAIPTGADPQAYLAAAETAQGPPDVPGGPPHFTNGMFGEVVVE